MSFRDEYGAIIWMADNPPNAVAAMTARAACRGLPILFNKAVTSDNEIIRVFRRMHASHVLSSALTTDAKCDAVLKSAADFTGDYSHFAVRACVIAMRSQQDHSLAAKNIRSFYSNDATKNNMALLATAKDSVQISQSVSKAITAPLWPDPGMPDWIADLWQYGIQLMERDVPRWIHWIDWYQKLLHGKPLDWELQRRVALIEDAIWEAGPEAVADEIEKIRALFDLEKRIEELEAERDAVNVRQDRLGIGGNNPPETIDDAPEIIRESTIIWAAVDELKGEIAKDAPDKAVVARIIETLSAGLKAILLWCGNKGDLTVDTLIKWGVPVGSAALLAKSELVTAVIEAAKAWLPFL